MLLISVISVKELKKAMSPHAQHTVTTLEKYPACLYITYKLFPLFYFYNESLMFTINLLIMHNITFVKFASFLI